MDKERMGASTLGSRHFREVDYCLAWWVSAWWQVNPQANCGVGVALSFICIAVTATVDPAHAGIARLARSESTRILECSMLVLFDYHVW